MVHLRLKENKGDDSNSTIKKTTSNSFEGMNVFAKQRLQSERSSLRDTIGNICEQGSMYSQTSQVYTSLVTSMTAGSLNINRTTCI